MYRYKQKKGKKKERSVKTSLNSLALHNARTFKSLSLRVRCIAIGFLTDAPFGMPGLINSVKNTDKQFYLVEKDDKQFFVTVTDEFIETRQLAKRMNGKKFEIGNWKFTKCAYEVK